MGKHNENLKRERLFPFKFMESVQLPPTCWPDLPFWANLIKRSFWIVGEIDYEYLDLMQFILLWNQEDEAAGIEPGEREPIKLFIFSQGGDAEIGDSLFEIVKSSKTPVIGYNMGLVASAAFDVYIACHKRVTLPGAKFLVHEGSMRIAGQASVVENFGDLSKKMKNRMIDRITSQTKITKSMLGNKIKSDWWFLSDEAIKYGVAHELAEDITELF